MSRLKELKAEQGLAKTNLAIIKERNKENKKINSRVAANFKAQSKIQLLTPQQISQEQFMIGQLFGHGGKFFGSGEMLPIAGDRDGEGSETWRSFGL